jgi:hypothetical protein
MPFDSGVTIKAIDANDIERGDVVVGVTRGGSYQRLEQSELPTDEPTAVAVSGQFYDRMDNPTYY